MGNRNYRFHICCFWRIKSCGSFRFYKCNRFTDRWNFDSDFWVIIRWRRKCFQWNCRITRKNTSTFQFYRKCFGFCSFCNYFYRNDVGASFLLGNKSTDHTKSIGSQKFKRRTKRIVIGSFYKDTRSFNCSFARCCSVLYVGYGNFKCWCSR